MLAAQPHERVQTVHVRTRLSLALRPYDYEGRSDTVGLVHGTRYATALTTRALYEDSAYRSTQNFNNPDSSHGAPKLRRQPIAQLLLQLTYIRSS